MKAISTYDLKIIPQLSHLTHFDLVNPVNDHLILPFLEIMGFDLLKPLQYTVSQHRTLANKVVVGYVIRGEVNTARKHLTSEWSTVYDKLVAAAYTDRSLCQEMASLMNNSLDYAAFHSVKEVDTPVPPSLEYPVTEEEERISKEITQLQDLLLFIRGSQYKQDGSLKLPHEYHEEEAIPKQRKKHIHLKPRKNKDVAPE